MKILKLLKIPKSIFISIPPNKKRDEMYVIYPRTMGFAWSRNGILAVFENERYDWRKITKKNRKIRNNKELKHFIGNSTKILTTDIQNEEIIDHTKSTFINPANIKQSAIIFQFEQFRKRSQPGSSGNSVRIPQLYKQNTTDMREENQKIEDSKSQNLQNIISLYVPIKNIYNIGKILASNYSVFEQNAYKSCLINSEICLDFNKPNLSRVWQILGFSLKDLGENMQKLSQWKDSPSGKILFQNLFSQFAKYFF